MAWVEDQDPSRRPARCLILLSRQENVAWHDEPARAPGVAVIRIARWLIVGIQVLGCVSSLC